MLKHCKGDWVKLIFLYWTANHCIFFQKNCQWSRVQQNIDIHENKNDNVFIVKPSYLMKKWKYFIRVNSYLSWMENVKMYNTLEI